MSKTVVITGGTGGIGYQSALGIARAGHRVIVTGRNRERGEAAVARLRAESGSEQIELAVGDLATQSGIQGLADDLRGRLDRIDVLINNAGNLSTEREVTADGFEKNFAVNVVAPYRLTHALMPLLEAARPARVLVVTGGTPAGKLDLSDLQSASGFVALTSYDKSKRAAEAMALSLARELEPRGVYANIIYPGRASTSMTGAMTIKSLPLPLRIVWPVFKLLMQRDDGGKSAANAARSSIWAVDAPELEEIAGQYWDMKMKRKPLHATVRDLGNQRRVMAEVTGGASAGA